MNMNGLRPCIIDEKVKALFHCWGRESRIHLAVLKGDISGVIEETFAIVEFKNGVVGKVAPERVLFADDAVSIYEQSHSLDMWKTLDNKKNAEMSCQK